MRKIEWTVRIVVWRRQDGHPDRDRASLWLGEFLRYAGLSRRLGDFTDREVFELQCRLPASHDTKIWAEQNAARLRSFGINAVAAPMWDGSSSLLEESKNT